MPRGYPPLANGKTPTTVSIDDGLTHMDSHGRARMVDVGGKAPTERRARARATVSMSRHAARVVARGDAPKGDVVGTARLAGIQAAKRTSELIPLCHQVPLTFVGVEISIFPDDGKLTIESEARTMGKTGVELEALTAASVAALAVYDMTKAVEKGVSIEDVRLLEKTGGRSDWSAPDPKR